MEAAKMALLKGSGESSESFPTHGGGREAPPHPGWRM